MSAIHEQLSPLVHSGDLYLPFENGYLRGYAKAESVSHKPYVAWTRNRIPMTLWREILSFFVWSYQDSKSETQVRLFYHPLEDRWAAWAKPQEYGTGMTTCELPEHPKNQECDMMFKGWICMGTVHHHCSSSAFQSSTDKHNEQNQTGIHITVGHLDKLDLDLHGRVTYVSPGVLGPDGTVIRPATCNEYDLEWWSDWFEVPEEVSCLPPSFHARVLKMFLSARPVDSEISFPAEWKENLIKVERAKVVAREWTPSGGGHLYDVSGPSIYGGWKNEKPAALPDKQKHSASNRRAAEEAALEEVERAEQEEQDALWELDTEVTQMCVEANIDSRFVTQVVLECLREINPPKGTLSAEIQDLCGERGVTTEEYETWLKHLTDADAAEWEQRGYPIY